MSYPPTPSEKDVESAVTDIDYLHNSSISTYAWSECNVVTAGGRRKVILDDVSGVAHAGRLLALMGPSGSGKTTLLNQLARRIRDGSDFKVSGNLLVDGTASRGDSFRALSAYVEQEDSLIGSLTAKETLKYAAMMASSKTLSTSARNRICDSVLAAFGMTEHADTIVGTIIRKGLSGGQKRRLSVAAQLITGPKILFLDEPTSGLDSTASREVIWFIKQVAVKFKLIVIVSIHQPSTATFNLFDDLCLLSAGKVCYFGPVTQVKAYLDEAGLPIPDLTNPAEHLLDLVSVDFTTDGSEDPAQRLDRVYTAWHTSALQAALHSCIAEIARGDGDSHNHVANSYLASPISIFRALLQRSCVKSYRDITVYAVRIAMYIGLAILMGTTWLRLGDGQEAIQPYINAIFFGGAFLSFMTVAYVPAYLEDYAVLAKERANGLYGPAVFVFTNFVAGLPYLLIISVVFTVITYWLIGLRNGADAVFTFILWLFLDLVAAESMVVFLSSVIPNGVIALVLVAFANGLWMAVNGFLVPLTILNPFYEYVFHYIDYQAVVFTGMMQNEFIGRTYACAANCQCMFPTGDLHCRIPGNAVLQAYGTSGLSLGQNVAIMIAIILAYRLLTLAILRMKRM